MVKRDLVNYIIVSLVLILAFIGLRLYVFEPYNVTSQDANDYIRKDEMVLALKTAKPDYGDLVLYEAEGKRYVGRIIAKAGDSVTYMDDVLYLNNTIKEEPYLDHLKLAHHKTFINGDYFTADFSIETLTQTVDGVIPKKEFLILNDVRTNNADSRSFGLIPRKKIIGIISFRLSPFSEFGFVDSI